MFMTFFNKPIWISVIVYSSRIKIELLLSRNYQDVWAISWRDNVFLENHSFISALNCTKLIRTKTERWSEARSSKIFLLLHCSKFFFVTWIFFRFIRADRF